MSIMNLANPLSIQNSINGDDTASANVPIGGIIIWSGASDNIPAGWAFFNGKNGIQICFGVCFVVYRTIKKMIGVMKEVIQCP